MDGLPDGLPDGVNDKAFTGLHRLEYGLWHAQSAASLEPVVAVLARDIAAVRKNLNVRRPGRRSDEPAASVAEILEDALRDHLSGLDDQGSGQPSPRPMATCRWPGSCWASWPR